jgi:hypothetical protein
VAELAQSHLFQRIVTVGHRPVPYDGPGKEKLEQHVVDFDKIDENKDLFADIDVGFNTMGTTHVQMQEVLKTLSKFDHDIPLHVASLVQGRKPRKTNSFLFADKCWILCNFIFSVSQYKGLVGKAHHRTGIHPCFDIQTCNVVT